MKKLKQVYVSTTKSSLTGNTLEVFKNSNVKELVNIDSFKSNKMIKGLIDLDTNDVYFWDIFDLLHKQMSAHLGLDFNRCVPLKIDFNEVEGEKALFISDSSAELEKGEVIRAIKSSKVIERLLKNYMIIFEKKESH